MENYKLKKMFKKFKILYKNESKIIKLDDTEIKEYNIH